MKGDSLARRETDRHKHFAPACSVRIPENLDDAPRGHRQTDQKWIPSARPAITMVERAITWMRRSQQIVPPAGIVKVNLGSALFVAPGWINIDGSLKTAMAGWPLPVLRMVYPMMSITTHNREEFLTLMRTNRFVSHNLKYGMPFPTGSVHYVFASHVLHHLYKNEALRLATDIRRALVPGGTLRVAVPDLEYIIALYLQGRREEAVEGYFFYPSASRSALSTRHYQYDFVLLKSLLSEAGFTNIRKCTCYHGDVPDLDRLDRLSKETLFVEADKAKLTE